MAAALIDLAVPIALVLAVTVAGLKLTAPMLIAVAGWTLFYYFALESAGGQTLGKRLTGVRVARPDGRPADLRQVAIRTVARIADGHVVGLIAMLATGERRQRLGDLAAGTIVTRAEAVSAEEGAPPGASDPATTPPSAVLPQGREDLPPGRAERARGLYAVPGGGSAFDPEPEPVVEPLAGPEFDDGPEPVVEPLAGSAFDDEPEPVVEPLAGPVFDDGPEPVVEPLAALGYEDADPPPVELLGTARDERPIEPPPAVESEDPAASKDPGPTVKPIETISAIDQVMQGLDPQQRSSPADRG
jgi:uncharacterized RDD family membrane protein YckC